MSDGSLFFCDSSFVRCQTIIFSEKNLRNLEFDRKNEFSRQLKLEHSSIGKSKYLTY